MLDTNGIYWILIGTGLALCAVNLPVTYGEVRRKGIEDFIGRMRSFTSLRSNRSAKSSGQEDVNGPWRKISRREDTKVSDSDIEMLHGLKQSDTYACQSQSFETIEEGGIHVTHTVDLKEN